MHDEQLNIVEGALRRLSRKSVMLQGARLLDNLERDTGIDTAYLRICLKQMRDKGWVKASSWTATGCPVGRVELALPAPPVPDWKTRWGDVLADAGLNDGEQHALTECGRHLSDMDSETMAALIRGLVKLKADQESLSGKPEFLVSAEYLLGSSKLLTALPSRALKAFGIDCRRFKGHPLYVVVAGCANPETVVLVENPASFELASMTKAVESCAFIATYGFGLSKSHEDYGNQLAKTVERHFSETVTLTRDGSRCPPANVLMEHEHITFWGDLDIAGMQIYARLRNTIAHLQLSALYRPMIDAITDVGSGHPYVVVTGKHGQQTMIANSADDPLVQEMLSACTTRAVDQEIVNSEQIERLAKLSY